MSERRRSGSRGTHRETSRAHREGLESRRVAIEIVRRVTEDGAYADLLLGEHLPAFLPPDRRLVTRIVLGTIAWLARLDYELEKLTGRPLDGIQPAALAIMRTALYQLRFLDRTPAHAVVDTAVTLAKESRDAKVAAGFINAVLRHATRETVAMPPREKDEAQHLAVKCSHPKWMVERFIAWFGIEGAERLMEADNDAAPNVIRLNLSRGSREEIVARLESEGFEIAAGGRSPETAILASAALMDSRAFAEGLFQPQSETSQLVSRMLMPAPGAIVADCAAAPGGKSTHLAELASASARIVALDQNLHGLASASAIARRLGHHNVAVVRADITAGVPLKPASFTHVLLDAPCTGLGTMREHPEIKWRLNSGDPARMAKLQLKMLESAAALVKPGGAIVDSVCSIAPDEGAGVVDAFLGAHREFEIDRRPPNYDEIKDLLDERGALKTRPDQGGLDGFFAIRMIRHA
jgi:16S rRNA (cytosine967-C5)-methyltransferase